MFELVYKWTIGIHMRALGVVPLFPLEMVGLAIFNVGRYQCGEQWLSQGRLLNFEVLIAGKFWLWARRWGRCNSGGTGAVLDQTTRFLISLPVMPSHMNVVCMCMVQIWI
jgi:hypothetical protein